MQNIRQFMSTVQNQPVRVRKVILVATSFSLMALIIIFWITTFSLSNGNTIAQNTQTVTEAPFSLVTDAVKDSYASALNGFKTTQQ